jgi:hypothetical protein
VPVALTERRAAEELDFTELVRRAQAAGEQDLRADFVPEDFSLLVLANQGVLRGTGEGASRLAPILGLLLDACRAEGAQRPAIELGDLE